jgi:NAD(P)-dependent dehydrogenase (short-subunit alcohol dehydrogenase family)
MKTILVTGASKGIGFSYVETMSKAGHDVYALVRSIPNNAPQGVHWITCDINQISETLPQGLPNKIDIVVHNAGFLVNKPFAEIKQEELWLSYQTNVFAPFRLTQLLLPYLGHDAHIINVSSIGGITNTQKFAGLTAYSSSKGALTILTECLQEEYKNTQWSFNAIAFGAVQTEMLGLAFPGYQAPIGPEAISEFMKWFTLEGSKYFKGKVLPVSTTNP